MKACEALQSLVGNKAVEFVTRGNAAIYFALVIAKKMGRTKVLVPDQGGWLMFKTYPKLLGMNIEFLPTDCGVINPIMIPVSDDAVLLYAQPAGYFAAQDAKGIYARCMGKTLVIMDASGSAGDKELCNGANADIIVGSFSEWKPINIGYGGFLSAKEGKNMELGRDILSTNKVHPSLEKDLLTKLRMLPGRYHFLYTKADDVKKDLQKHAVLHPAKKGLNVVVAYHHEKEKGEVIAYCKKKKLGYTQCPRYIRVTQPAISIEIKRL